MWLLSLLPDAVFHAMLLVGLLALGASFVLKFVPFVAQYKLPIQVAAGLLIIFSVYMEGGIAVNDTWQKRVHELEAKVAESEKQAVVINQQVDNAANKKVQVIKEIQYLVKDQLKSNAQSIDAKCVVDNSVVTILNTAAQSQKPQGGKK